MEIKVNALALKCVDYRDNDKMVTLYSLERGLIGVCVRGVKKAGAKLGFCAQPFCFAEYVINESGNRMTVTGATEIESFYKIRLDLHAFYAGACILEFLLKFTRDEEPDKRTFVLAVESLKRINFGDGLPERVLADFLFKETEISGYAIGSGACACCGKAASDFEKCYFDSDDGVVVCEDCFSDGMREIMPCTAIALSAVSAGKDFCDKSALKYLLKFFNYYYRLKTGEYVYSIDELVSLP